MSRLETMIVEQTKRQYPHGPTKHQRAYRKEIPASDGETSLQFQIAKMSVGVPIPQENIVLFPEVKGWCFDKVWTRYRIIVEVDGGVFSRGRHTRGRGYTEDCRKLNHATGAGWQVFRFTTEQVVNGEAIRFLEALFSRLPIS